MKKFITPIIILFWIFTMFLLIYRYAPSSGLDTDIKSLTQENNQRWMGIYLKNQKIGFVSSTFYEEIDGYAIDESIQMRLNVLGTPQDIRSKTRVSLSPELKIRTFQFTLNATQDIYATGRIHNRMLILDIRTESSQSRKEILLDEIPQLPLTIIPYLLKKGLRKGTRATFPVFDPVTLSMQKMRLEVIGKEKIRLHDKELDAIKIKGDLNGLHLLMWIDEQGNELKEESLMGFTLIAEPKEKALHLPYSASEASDLIIQTAIPFNLEIPEDVSFLKLRLKGINLEGLDINRGRQTLKGDIVEIVQEDINTSMDGPLLPEEIEEFLKDSPFIQTKAPEIAELAKTIIGEEKNPLEMGRLLWAWVFENVEKIPSITVPSALDVLKTRRGDCNEHTVLFTALARSAGLPTRINIGLVYKNGFFYYHAWPEIFAGKWVAIDPTLGQFPASAAHVALISGDFTKQLMLLRVINKIKLEGLEYREKL
jgi:hypothetical protein